MFSVRKFMGSGQLVKCICNQTHGGDVCSHCGLPHSTARYLSRTGPLLPFFILACMATVFCFNHYNIADRLNRQIEETQEFIPIIISPATPLSSKPDSKPLPPELLEKKAYHCCTFWSVDILRENLFLPCFLKKFLIYHWISKHPVTIFWKV